MHGPLGIMLKVTSSGAMPAAFNFLPITVFAAADDGEKEAGSVTLNRDDLSLYSVPKQKFEPVESEAGALEESVATLRKAVEPYAAWCQGTYDKIKPKVQSVVRFGSDSYAYLKNPPKDFYPRAGVIGFTGILGVFLARGSRIKKVIYPAGLMTVSASLYYPEQSANIAKSAGDSVYDRAVQTYAALEKMVYPQKNKDAKDSETKP